MGVPGVSNRQSRGALQNRLLEFTRNQHVETGGAGAQWQFGRTLATDFGQEAGRWALRSILGDLAQSLSPSLLTSLEMSLELKYESEGLYVCCVSLF
jgi:hypothetical protein